MHKLILIDSYGVLSPPSASLHLPHETPSASTVFDHSFHWHPSDLIYFYEHACGHCLGKQDCSWMGNAVQPSLRGGTAEPTGSCTGELSQAAFLTVHIDPSKSMRAYLDDSFLVLLLICEFGAL